MAITEKQKAAQLLGRLGGLKGGKARAQSLSPERRREIAQKAVAARWAKSAIPPASSAPGVQSLPFGREFFESKTIDQIIAEQGLRPVGDISILAGTISDEDMDEFVAEIYRDRLAG